MKLRNLIEWLEDQDENLDVCCGETTIYRLDVKSGPYLYKTGGRIRSQERRDQLHISLNGNNGNESASIPADRQ